LSTTNPTCCPDVNPGRRGGKPATNRLSYGTAIFINYCSINLRETVKVGVKELHFQRHVTAKFFIA
jgi:hypothetical protein